MKEKIGKKGIKKRLFSVVLALAMVVTLMPMGGIVAYAATTPICRCDEHDQHVNIYKIENENVYYYWYEGNTYQGMSNRKVSSFTSTYGISPVNGNWYYSNYRSPVSAGECGVANAIPDCGCDGHDQHVYIYKIENGNVYYYWYEKNTYGGMDNRTVSNFTSTFGTPEQGNWYYSNYRSPVSAGTCDDASHFHTYNMTVWSSDASNHWHPATCSHSTQKKDAAAHGNWNATTGKCGTCGYECLHTGQTGATCAVCGKTLHTHTWEYSLDGTNTIKAHCKTAGHSGDDVTLTLTASSANYSGSPIAKATLFGGMDFTAFNNATGLNLSAEDIKIYTAADTSKASALDSVNAAGSYVADLTVDTDKTATLDFTVGRAPNAYTFVYANTVGWDFYPMLAEILKTNGVGGDTITIKNSLESGPAIAVKTSGGPDSDDSWNGSSISCTPGSSTNLTIPTNYVVDMVQLNGLEFVCKLKSVHTHNFTYTASGATLTATCDADGCGLTDKKVSLTLTASDTNYSGSSGSSTPVTFTKVYGTGTLSSANLGTPTSWTYDDTTYQVYNAFIPSSSGSSWIDAMGFVNALNDANYDGHTDWTLLSSKEMAKAYAASGTGAMPDSSDRGAVNFLWSSVEYDWSMAYGLYDGGWYTDYQWSTDSLCGFVVLRPASGSTGTPTNKIVTVGNDTERAAWKAVFGDDSIPEVHYVSRTGSPTTLADTTTEPTAKGRYTASISAGDPAATATVDFDIIDKHAHSFTYSADGAVLTATCNHSGDLIENCDLANNKVSLTLTASSANYSGSVVTARYGDGEAAAWKAAVGSDAPTITYTAKTGSSLTDGKAVNAGSYTASITVGTGDDAKTATKDFTIAKATPTVTAVPTASAITYGQTLANSTLTGGAASVQGAFAWTTSTTAPAVSDSGKTEYAVTFTPNDTTNYNTATCKVKVTVNKATGSGSVTMNGWTYGGTASDPVPTSTTNGTGSVTYAYKVKNAADSTYAAATPTNAGTYTVKATFAATDNYTQATATADFTIAKASQAAPAASEGYTLNYAAETLTATTGYEVSSTKSENATALPDNKVTPGATYYVRKPASDTNHADSAWTKITIPARPAATDLTGTMETIKNKKDASLSGVTSAMEYRMGTETNWTAGTGAVIANPDNLTIYVRTRATAGAFAGETQTIPFTPSTAKLTVTMGDTTQSVPYGGKATKIAPTKEGYTFGGWYKDAGCKTAWNFGSDTVSKNTTLYAKWIRNAVQKAAINGIVKESSNGVSGATVELYLGTVKVAATVTDESGSYRFDNVEDGIYNIVVTKGDKTKTEMVTVDTADNFEKDVELPNKAVSSVVEHTGEEIANAKSDISKTVVGGLDAIAATQAPTAGQTITIKLKVEPKKDTGTDEHKKIKSEAGNGKTVEFLDLSLFKQVNDGTPENIGNGNNTLLTIVIPFDFTGVDVRSVMILRNHGGNTEKLTGTANANGEYFKADEQAGTLTIFAKKFSDYAVAYSNASHGGGSYTPGHTVTSDLKSVTKVTIDGKVVDSRYYTVSGGNIILSGEFMKTLTNGKHTVKLYDGLKVATGVFTVTGNVAVASAATGDAGLALYAALSVSSVLGMGWVGRKKRGEE